MQPLSGHGQEVDKFMGKNEKRLIFIIFISIWIMIFILTFCGKSHALDRCQEYIPEIRTQSFHYFGLNFPYCYNVGQAKQESACRANITSFDYGEGLYQFTGSTKNWVREQMGEDLNFYNPSHAIKAGAWYMSQLHKQNWDGALWLTYQAYNGGWKLLKAENIRACHCSDHDVMRQFCQRKTITLKSGNKLNFCDVNYDYSRKVYKYGQIYRTFEDKWRFW